MELKWTLLRIPLIFFISVTFLHTNFSFGFINHTELDSFPKREFRGVWVATVNNIDWPSRSGLSANAQKKEFVELVNYCKSLGMNALIVQVRSSADAFYDSRIEPWSHWLTGKQGKAPQPYYDPLHFMIETCHKNDLEFHAWINPFRSVQSRYMKLSDQHIANKQPDWHFTYNGMQLLDPGIPAVRNYLYEVIDDIISRYPVDAIHFDDYFYPYPAAGEKINDRKSYQLYNPKGFGLAQWRRENINTFIREVSLLIKKRNKHIKFGVSPPGIWRNRRNDPKGSKTNGLSAYDDLFADSRLWVQKGWIDYIIPQIYWNVSHKIADYQTLIDWWQNQETTNTQLYVGHAAYKIADSKLKAWKDGKEINRQVKRNRQKARIMGSAFFSANSLIKNHKNFAHLLKDELFKQPALRPENQLDLTRPLSPLKMNKLKTDKGWWLTWQDNLITSSDSTLGYLLYRFPDTTEVFDYENAKNLLTFLPKDARNYHDSSGFARNYNYVLTAYNRFHNESAPAYQVFEDTTQIVINNVVVGFGKAQVDAVFQSDLKMGSNRILLNNLPQTLINESFTVVAPVNTSITALKIVSDTLTAEINLTFDSLLNHLENKTIGIQHNINRIEDTLLVIKESEEILKKNKTISPENTSVESLKKLDNYLTNRLLELKAKERSINQKLHQLNKKFEYLKQLKKQYTNELSLLETGQKKSVLLDIVAEKSLKTTFELSYQVSNVNWAPRYKLNYNKYSNQISIKYEASILQQSGQNWENIPISVSSKLYSNNFADSVKAKPSIFKVAPQNATIPHSENEKLILLGEETPQYETKLLANVDSVNTPNILLTLFDATQYEWYHGKMQVFIDKQLEKEIDFEPKTLNDTLNLIIGIDPDIQIKKEIVYDSLKNYVVVKEYKHSERIIIKNDKSKKAKIYLTGSAISDLKQKPATRFLGEASNSFNFEQQLFIWDITLESGEKKEIINTYSFQKGMFSKKE